MPAESKAEDFIRAYVRASVRPEKAGPCGAGSNGRQLGNAQSSSIGLNSLSTPPGNRCGRRGVEDDGDSGEEDRGAACRRRCGRIFHLVCPPSVHSCGGGPPSAVFDQQYFGRAYIPVPLACVFAQDGLGGTHT